MRWGVEEAKKFWLKEEKKKYTLPGKGENSSRHCEEERKMINGMNLSVEEMKMYKLVKNREEKEEKKENQKQRSSRAEDRGEDLWTLNINYELQGLETKEI